MIKKVYKITMAVESNEEGLVIDRSITILAETAMEAVKKVTLVETEFVHEIEFITAINIDKDLKPEASEEPAEPEEKKEEEKGE